MDSAWTSVRARSGAEPLAKPRTRLGLAFGLLLGALFTVLAGLPLFGQAIAIAAGRPDAYLDGDQGIDELALMRSQHFAQLTGNYSRFGWDHPGPSWFYAIDPVYTALGSHSYAFYVGVLLLHALFAMLIVAVLWRAAGPLAAGGAAVLVLAYLAVLTAYVWRDIWPPFAPILPMALLFPLAAWGAVRSTSALVGALIIGSYAIQAHVGTTLTVIAVWVVMVAVRLFWIRTDHRSGLRGGRASTLTLLLVPLGVLVLIVMWVPVAVDQVAGQHNLTRLAQFFLSGSGQHGWRETLSALGTLLGTYTSGNVPYLLQAVWVPMPTSAWIGLGGFAVLTAALFVAAMAFRDRYAQVLALLLGVTFPVVLLSVKHVAGPIYPYFLLWITALPMVLAIGGVALVARQAERLRGRLRLFGVASLAVSALLLIPAALEAAKLPKQFDQLPHIPASQYDPYSRQAWGITAAALRGLAPQPIVIVITYDSRIPLAGGLALQLGKAGWPIEVNSEWNYIFGPDSLAKGDARLELVLVDPRQHQMWESRLPGKRLIGVTPDTEIYLRPLYPGESP